MSLPIIHFTLTKGSRSKLLRKKPRRRISIMPRSNTLFLLTTFLDDSLLPTMDAGELAERIRTMRKQEKYHRCDDYMRDTESLISLASTTVDEESRIKMCEWCFQVVDFCKFRRETVGIGMSYLDRYLATEGHAALTDRKFYQLAAMTCLYMAIKIHEPLEMETSLLADLSRGCYTDLQIAEMELEILEALEWRLASPTPLAFVQHFLALLSLESRIKAAIMDYARYQTELAISCLDLVPRDASEIALAAILNAMEGIDRSLLPLRKQGGFVRSVERVSGMFVEQVADIQDILSDILIGIYPDNTASDASSSIHWDLLSTTDDTDSFKSMSRSTISSRTGDRSPVWVGESSYSSYR